MRLSKTPCQMFLNKAPDWERKTSGWVIKTPDRVFEKSGRSF